MKISIGTLEMVGHYINQGLPANEIVKIMSDQCSEKSVLAAIEQLTQQNKKLTPEYIVSIKDTLTDEELIELIKDYGEQQYEEGSYWGD